MSRLRYLRRVARLGVLKFVAQPKSVARKAPQKSLKDWTEAAGYR
jgi:hypothetical protein